MAPEQSAGKIGKSVGEKLRAARVAQNYTQSQLAFPDFSVSYISAIERGQIHPSLRALEILSARLGLSSTQLLPNRARQDGQQSSVAPEREEDEEEMALLGIQVLLEQGAVEQAMARLGKISPKRMKRNQQLHYRYLQGWAYFLVGRLQECEHIFFDAAQLAEEANTFYLHIQLLTLLGMTYAAMQNYSQALLSHQRCLNLLEEMEVRDPFVIAQIYLYLGQDYASLGNYNEALNMFNKSVETASEFGTTEQAQVIYRNLCQYYADSDDFFAATLYAHKSLSLSKLTRSKQLKSDLYYYLGQAILREDEEAYTTLTALVQRENQDGLVEASLQTRIAQWQFAHEHVEEAEQCARKAAQLAQPFEDTIIGADALILLGRIEYTLKNIEQGDKHLTEGLTMLERLGRLEELAEQAVRYAQLLEEQGKEREAFTYFRLAFKSSQKQGL